MFKWILVYWLTWQESDLVLRERYDSSCQCWFTIPSNFEWKSDTTKKEFKTKKAATIFLRDKLYTDYRIDSIPKYFFHPHNK